MRNTGIQGQTKEEEPMRETGKKKQRKQRFDPCPSGWHYGLRWWAHERSFQCNGQGRSQIVVCCKVNGKGQKVEILSTDLSFKSLGLEEKEGDSS